MEIKRAVLMKMKMICKNGSVSSKSMELMGGIVLYRMQENKEQYGYMV